MRRLLPALAALCAFAAAASPGLQREEARSEALIVLDITRSMNTRDMQGQSRLDFARSALTGWLGDLPCGSRIGLAIFSERRSLTLITPVEICEDYESLAGILESIDWRMAWEGDSLISKAVNHAMARAAGLDVALVFVTDGHEAPPLPYEGPARPGGETPGGLILGVGGASPSPIPLFNDEGREAGFYGSADVQQFPARIGPPPEDASERPGYHPRQNPYGEADLEGASEHLSMLRETHLREIAAARGLGYLPLAAGSAALSAALVNHARPAKVSARFDISPWLGLSAAVLILALWLMPLLPQDTKRKEVL